MTSLLTRIGFAAAGLAAAAAHVEAAPVAVKAADKVKDLTSRVEIVPAGRLRPTADQQARVSVSLWNTTENDILGPIYLIVDGAGIDEIALQNHPEETKGGKAVFEVLPVGQKLLAHAVSPALPLEFSTPTAFAQEQANEFRLKARVFGREVPSEETMAKRQDEGFATRGKSYDAARLAEVIALQERLTPDLMKRDGVLGTGVAEDSKGRLVMRVYTETRGQAKTLPGSLEGLSLDVQAIPGGLKAGPARDTVIFKDGKPLSRASRAATAANSTASPSAAPGGDPTIRFDRPVPIGVSAFNATESICAGGTLGVRCRDASGKVYALSNAHVFAKESLSVLGEEIVQPSQLDNACNVDLDENKIGALVDFVTFNTLLSPNSVPFNYMDCALMEVHDALDPEGNLVPAVDVATPEDGYGIPSSNVLRANRIGLMVQKYGRTTIYTRGFTSATNVLSVVAYGIGPVMFMNMDEYKGIAPDVSLGAPGDSGSLIVTVDGNRPVSLLFAGGGGFTFGNPIGRVLDRFNVTIDDGSKPGTTGGVDNSGTSGRVGTAITEVGQDLRGLLPPELWDRIKNRQQNGQIVGPATPAP